MQREGRINKEELVKLVTDANKIFSKCEVSSNFKAFQ